jgi:Ca2+-binding RTX toxin-like protein
MSPLFAVLQRRRPAAHKPKTCTLRVEELEDRQLLSGGTATLRGGVLILRGTPGSDRVVIRFGNPGQIDIVSGPREKSLPLAAVTRIVARGFGGNDYFENSTAIPGYIDGGSGNDTIIGGSGNDTILGGPGNDRLVAGWGDDVVYGGKGTNTLGQQATYSTASFFYGSDLNFTSEFFDHLGPNFDQMFDYSGGSYRPVGTWQDTGSFWNFLTTNDTASSITYYGEGYRMRIFPGQYLESSGEFSGSSGDLPGRADHIAIGYDDNA